MRRRYAITGASGAIEENYFLLIILMIKCGYWNFSNDRKKEEQHHNRQVKNRNLKKKKKFQV